MKIKSTRIAQDPQTSQGVNSTKLASQGANGAGLNLSQEFKGLMATFAGGVSQGRNELSLDTFQVEPLSPIDLIQELPRPTPQGPTDVQTSMQAGAAGQTSPAELPEQASQDSLEQSPADQKEPAVAPVVAEQHSKEGPAPDNSAMAGGKDKTITSDQLDTAEVSAAVTSSTVDVVTHDGAGTPAQTDTLAAHALDQPRAEASAHHILATPAPQTETAANSASNAPSLTSSSSAVTPAETELSQLLAEAQPTLAPQESFSRLSKPFAPSSSAVAALLTQDLIHGLAQSAGVVGAASSTTDSAVRQVASSAVSSNTSMLNTAGSVSAPRNSTNTEARSARLLPPATASQAFERVEQTLKEVARSKDGKSISLLLNPSELGQVKVDVTLREGTLHARLAAENPQVAQLLRDRAQDLQGTLRKLGLDVDTISVAVQGDGQSFGQLNEQLGGRNWQSPSDNGRSLGSAQLGSNPILHGIAEMTSNPQSALDHWVA